MEQNQQIKTQNNVYVVGKLKEKNLTFKQDANGRLMCHGSLTIETNTKLGKGEVKARVFQYALKKDGTENALFKSLQTVENEYKSIVTHGVDEADTIKVDGDIADGTYYSDRKGDFVEKTEIRATFINRVSAETEHRCKVVFEGFINSIEPFEDTLKVTVVGIGYNGVAIPLTGELPTELVAPFSSRYSVGATATLNFSIVNTVKTKEIQSEVAFGEALGEVITTVVSKNIIFGGSSARYDGISDEQIKRAFALREVELNKKKERSMNNSNASDNNQIGFGNATGGFTAPSQNDFANSFTTTNVGGFSMPTGSFGV